MKPQHTNEKSRVAMKKFLPLLLVLLFSFVTIAAAADDPGTPSASTASEASRVLKNGPGFLNSLVGHHVNTSGGYIHIYNSTTVPANGATPVVVFAVKPYVASDPSTGNFSCDIPVAGLKFSTGISVAFSTTRTTKTTGAADFWFVGTVR